MIFGNWIVTEDSIAWTGPGVNRFLLHKDEMLSTRQTGFGTEHYEYILLATSEDWLTENDLYDFNYAFVYAAAKFNLPLSYEIFDATLAEQYEQFEEEEDDDEEWS